VVRQYPTAKITPVADSGAGVITERFLQIDLEQWNAAAVVAQIAPRDTQP